MVKLPQMQREEIERVIGRQRVCRIAFGGDKYPYIALFQYAYINGTLYFHFTSYGKKVDLLEKNARVCVEIEEFRPDLSEYRFVVLMGTLVRVAEPQERAVAIRRMAEAGKEGLSPNFLAAHGFRREEGWSSFIPEKPLTIMKLTDVAEVVALKSP